MAVTITKNQRLEVEARICQVMDILDTTGTNTEYYKTKFARMSDEEFVKNMSKKFPLKFHVEPMVIEPTIYDCEKALNLLGSSIMETIYLPHVYEDKDGNAVGTSDKAITIYIHLPKVQQMITKKNKNSIDTENRDMKSGRLVGDDKGAATTDREFECMATLGVTTTMDEFSRFRADAMDAKSVSYSIIRDKGLISQKEIPIKADDSLSKQYMNVYMIGAHINSNIINTDNYTPYTLKNKSKRISRE